jgi:hypothetical protein
MSVSSFSSRRLSPHSPPPAVPHPHDKPPSNVAHLPPTVKTAPLHATSHHRSIAAPHLLYDQRRSNDNAFVPWSFQFNKPLHLLLTPSEFDFQVLKK